MDQSGWLESVVDATTDGLWVLDRRGVTLWANEGLAILLGRDLDEMAGLSSVRALCDAVETRRVGQA